MIDVDLTVNFSGIPEKLQETETVRNLVRAFIGESIARNRYDYFASQAKKSGYEQISAIFALTALNEKEHAKIWFKELNQIGITSDNLLTAVKTEREEWKNMYIKMADTARKEGFEKIAERFEQIADIEHFHENRFMRLYENMIGEEVFKKPKAVMWECRNCGHIVVGSSAPDICPVCEHEQAYFQILCQNY